MPYRDQIDKYVSLDALPSGLRRSELTKPAHEVLDRLIMKGRDSVAEKAAFLKCVELGDRDVAVFPRVYQPWEM